MSGEGLPGQRGPLQQLMMRHAGDPVLTSSRVVELATSLGTPQASRNTKLSSQACTRPGRAFLSTRGTTQARMRALSPVPQLPQLWDPETDLGET